MTIRKSNRKSSTRPAWGRWWWRKTLSLVIKKRNRNGFETFVSLYLLSEADVYCTLEKKKNHRNFHTMN